MANPPQDEVRKGFEDAEGSVKRTLEQVVQTAMLGFHRYGLFMGREHEQSLKPGTMATNKELLERSGRSLDNEIKDYYNKMANQKDLSHGLGQNGRPPHLTP